MSNSLVNCGFGGKIRTQSFQKLFSGGHLFVFVEYLCKRSPKIKTKNIKNCSSILAIVNHWNWLDDSPPLKYKIEGEINAVNKWMIANKLTLNMYKSNVIIINSNKNDKSSKNCYNEVLPIMIVKNAKYLGVTFDESLSCNCHIKNLIKRLSQSVGFLAKVKPFLNTKALLNLYYAIFHLHLQYGLITWSPTFKCYLKKLSSLQNKALKIVGGAKYL